jgi:hypothetical protein
LPTADEHRAMSMIRRIGLKRALRRERNRLHFTRAAIRAAHSLGGMPAELRELSSEEYEAFVQAEALRHRSEDRQRLAARRTAERQSRASIT